jgi:hypothetical protein
MGSLLSCHGCCQNTYLDPSRLTPLVWIARAWTRLPASHQNAHMDKTKLGEHAPGKLIVQFIRLNIALITINRPRSVDSLTVYSVSLLKESLDSIVGNPETRIPATAIRDVRRGSSAPDADEWMVRGSRMSPATRFANRHLSS